MNNSYQLLGEDNSNIYTILSPRHHLNNLEEETMSIFKTKNIALILVTIGMIMTQHTVLAENNTADTNWVLVGDSPLLDRSSKFLSNGYTRAGIRYAKKALARSQSKYSDLIARHNLCIGYHLQREVDTAAAHCALARTMPMTDVSLKMIKPGLYKISRRNQVEENAIKLETIIAQNLEIDGLNRELPRIAQTQ
jgi:hypothetical protein